MNSTFLEVGCEEWEKAWNSLKEEFEDTSCECPQTGEVWQYMGTMKKVFGYVHSFRHRSLNGERRYREYLATRGWTPTPTLWIHSPERRTMLRGVPCDKGLDSNPNA
jgi:hypothetical protein